MGRSQARTARQRFLARGASLGLRASGVNGLIQQVERGLPFKALQSLERYSGIAAPTIAATIAIPQRTLARRRASGRLSREESDRLLRLSTVFEKTVDLFEGDVAAAVRWLTTGQTALAGGVPLEYCRTEVGAREVEDLIGRLEYGVFA